MNHPIRWGFVGTGRIAHRLMQDLPKAGNARLEAVYGRNAARAEAFAAQHGAAGWYDRLEDLLAHGIDLAYIATPHASHLQFAEACLRAGVPVLCEKTMTPNLQQSQRLVQTARERGVFLMEAVWTRCFPVSLRVRDWMREGRIGNLVAATGVHAFRAPEDEADRLLAPEDAGGALLDIGVYPLSMLQFFTGQNPAEITALGSHHANGVDLTDGLVLRYPDGAVATVLCSFRTDAPDALNLLGAEGRIEVGDQFWRPRRARLYRGEELVEEFTDPGDGEGFHYEAAHVGECLDAGLTESPLVPLDDTLALIRAMDGVRAQLGVRYPFE